jgi:hypothetical protein
MASSKKIEEAVAEKRGMNLQDDGGPIPAAIGGTPVEYSRGAVGETMDKKAARNMGKKMFMVKGVDNTRMFNLKGTHFEVEDGIMYLYDENEAIGVFGLTNFAVEIKKIVDAEEVD